MVLLFTQFDWNCVLTLKVNQSFATHAGKHNQNENILKQVSLKKNIKINNNTNHIRK